MPREHKRSKFTLVGKGLGSFTFFLNEKGEIDFKYTPGDAYLVLTSDLGQPAEDEGVR